MTSDGLLSGDELTVHFGVLLDRLAARGVTVETYIIGGVAMAIHLGRDELTPDVDGYFRPQTEVFAEAEAMADEFGLAPDWVNSRAAAFISFDPADDVDALQTEIHGHKVTVASKRVLLAMKIAASRTKDRDDINRLIIDLGITDPEDIVDLAFSVFGEDSMTLTGGRDEVRLLATEALSRARKYAKQTQPGPTRQGRRPAGATDGSGGQFDGKRNTAPEVSL